MNSNFDNSCNNCIKISQANRRYQYLLSSLTHEIRNPLTLIYSSLQLIEKRCPEVCELLLWRQVKEDVRSTIRLLRDLSHPENSGNSRLHTVMPSSLLDQIASSCHAFMAEQNVALISEIDSDLPPISGNEIKLKEAIINLLLNACDAAANHHVTAEKSPATNATSTPTSSISVPSPNAELPQGKVYLRAHLCGQQIHIHVRDNGAGIPASDRASIFEPFVTHKATGTGLGLSIIREVARQHHGTLTLDTSTAAPDSYTDFCLILPVSTNTI